MNKSQPTEVFPAEIDRFETQAYIEVLRSNGRKVRVRTFGELGHRLGTPDQRAAKRRRLRKMRMARRANGESRKALMQLHGVDPANIRFVRQR
jgi:hypothetical protein